MKPKTRIEKEVARLRGQLPILSNSMRKWAVDNCLEGQSVRQYRGKPTAIAHFIVVTQKGGWQVLRHFYLYAVYRYRKLHTTQFVEVMQQWYHDGEYVFFSLPRQGLGCYMDAWCNGKEMELRRGRIGGAWLCDPRDLSYDKVKYIFRQPRFRYLPNDDKCKYRIDELYRAVNASPFNETLVKCYPEVFDWSLRNDFFFDREKTAAIKIALRYGYHFMCPEWKDMVNNLAYLGKDLHNPTLVCPAVLAEAHDRWMVAASNKRQKHSEKMQNLAQIRAERQHLRQLQAQEELARERKKQAEAAVGYYVAHRKQFFGLVIAEDDIEIKVLQSVEEFMEEGAEMCHCVFSNGYYDVKKRPFCLILSAKVSGQRTETIEVDMRDYRIVQSRGKHNSNSQYHDQIIALLTHNMGKIQQINKKSNRPRVNTQEAAAV